MFHSEDEQSETEGTSVWTPRLDQLSVRLMVEGVNEETLAGLRSMGQEAKSKGSVAFATRTEDLVASLEEAGKREAEGILKAGMNDLRSLSDNKRSDAAASSAAAYAALGDDAELVADFLVEAREHLSQIEGQMLLLERDPAAMEIIHTVFRAFHTIKGLAGFLGFAVIQSVAHEVETLLDLARNEKLRVDSAMVDVLLESADFLLVEMASIDKVLAGAPSIDPADPGPLIAKIKVLSVILAEPEATESAAQPAGEAPSTEAAKKPRSSNRKPPAKPRAGARGKEAGQEKPASVSSEGVSTTGQADASVSGARQSSAGEDTDDFFPAPVPIEVSHSKSAVPTPEQIELPAGAAVDSAARVLSQAKEAALSRSAEHTKMPDSGSVRVETAKLDHLMDMVGEMVIAQSLIQHSQVFLTATDSRLMGNLAQLARVTAEVQRATMSMRMVPVGQLFQKIERVIRDLSRKAGKQVVLQTSGTDTEVDKTVAEELSDPLLHMIRNSVDHGIETAEERIAAGKSVTAQIRLAAYHQGGQVVIEISDDGRGLNAEKIRAKAEQKELISSSAQLTETEIFQLIFAPGFSTAEKITDVSGRGVGMDVVRRNVEKLRGRIETQSTLGSGTTFLLKLPLTLAIIDGLVVEVGENQYIVPLSQVREIFRPLDDTLFTIEGREEMALVRDQLLPIVRLNQRLGVKSRISLPSEGLLVVIESEGKRYCLLVDDLLGKQEVVIKALGEMFKDVSGLSGCAVLGDGRVGLILDTDGIYRGRRR